LFNEQFSQIGYIEYTRTSKVHFLVEVVLYDKPDIKTI